MKAIFNRTPLIPNACTPLSPGAIRPEGWLGAQLKALESAICENTQTLFAGEGGWEREMYAFEALVLLAYTQENDALKEEVACRAGQILASQDAEGWFGPADEQGYWPRILALRALRRYFEATADRDVLRFMDAFFKYQHRTLATHPLGDAAVARGGDNILLALWLYNITGQNYLLELCRRLREQTLDWPNYFHTFPNPQPLSRTLRWPRLKEALYEEKTEPMEGEHRPYFHTQYYQTNGENIAIGLRTPGAINLFKSGFKEQGGFRFGWEKLMKYHGVASGVFTADAHINGSSPTQGTTLTTVCELLNTLQALAGMGEMSRDIPDILEKVAFNALPAAWSQDMRRVQTLEQVNQVLVSAGERAFYNADPEALLYRAPTSFEAVRALSAWPLFVSHLWYATSDAGLWAMSYAPCCVRARLMDVPVRLHVSGGYPFADAVRIEVAVKRPVEFPLYLRMPAWSRQPMIYLPDGEIMQVRAGETACVRRRWQSGDVVRLELSAAPHVSRGWYHQSAAIELGPLLMALAPEPHEEGERISTPEEWGWALVRDEPMKTVRAESAEAPFKSGEAPVKVLAKAVPIDWEIVGDSSAPVPILPRLDAKETYTIELIPFGWTDLRIAQFPIGELRRD